MSSVTQELWEAKLIDPPDWLPQNVHYETVTGSLAYGTAGESSDWDVYGFAIPPKSLVFPHLAGLLIGFDAIPGFEQYSKHHIVSTDRAGRPREYDLTVFGIVKYFALCVDGNPNMIDTLFTPTNCVLHQTSIGTRVRDARRLFLSKKVWHTFKGYAYQQLKKLKTKNPDPGSKRGELVERFGFDTKFAGHVVRLLLEAEQILTTGDLDLQRDREQIKAVREGRWTLEQVEDFFTEKERSLERVYHESNAVPYEPPRAAIKALLLECLERHYTSLSEAIVLPDAASQALREIRAVLEKYRPALEAAR